MIIFCQNCFENTHDITKSVNASNTNGSCAKCGSFAVIDAAQMVSEAQVGKIATKVLIEEITPRREPRRIQSNTDFVRTEDIREFLKRYSFNDAEHWWDGTYFEHHLWFLVEPDFGGSDFEIMIENRDGRQKNIKFLAQVRPWEGANG